MWAELTLAVVVVTIKRVVILVPCLLDHQAVPRSARCITTQSSHPSGNTELGELILKPIADVRGHVTILNDYQVLLVAWPLSRTAIILRVEEVGRALLWSDGAIGKTFEYIEICRCERKQDATEGRDTGVTKGRRDQEGEQQEQKENHGCVWQP